MKFYCKLIFLLIVINLSASEKPKFPEVPLLDLSSIKLELKQRQKRLKYTPDQLKKIREKLYKEKTKSPQSAPINKKDDK